MFISQGEAEVTGCDSGEGEIWESEMGRFRNVLEMKRSIGFVLESAAGPLVK